MARFIFNTTHFFSTFLLNFLMAYPLYIINTRQGKRVWRYIEMNYQIFITIYRRKIME